MGTGSNSTAITHRLLPHVRLRELRSTASASPTRWVKQPSASTPVDPYAPHPYPYAQVEVTVKGAKRRIYAYEVDGLGGVLASFDDPNIPSLLSIPVLGYSHYDPQIYQDTRATILSSANRYRTDRAE